MFYLQKLKKQKEEEKPQQEEPRQPPQFPQNFAQRLIKKKLSGFKNKTNFTPQPSRQWGKELGLQMPLLALDQDEAPPPLVLGFTGLPHCGKTSVIKRLQEGGPSRFAILDTRHFYIDTPPDQISPQNYNYDLPQAIEWDLFMEGVKKLINRQSFERPVYDMKENRRVKGEYKTITPSDIVIIEGPLILYHEGVRSLIDLKVYIDADRDVSLSRRIMSKLESSKLNDQSNLEKFIDKYLTMVKPAFEKYVEPSKRHADIIIPNYGFEADTRAINVESKEEFKIDLNINSTAVDLILRKMYSYFGHEDL